MTKRTFNLLFIGLTLGAAIGISLPHTASPNKPSHPQENNRVQVLNIQGCEYITFNSQTIIHKSNCTNEVHLIVDTITLHKK